MTYTSIVWKPPQNGFGLPKFFKVVRYSKIVLVFTKRFWYYQNGFHVPKLVLALPKFQKSCNLKRNSKKNNGNSKPYQTLMIQSDFMNKRTTVNLRSYTHCKRMNLRIHCNNTINFIYHLPKLRLLQLRIVVHASNKPRLLTKHLFDLWIAT